MDNTQVPQALNDLISNASAVLAEDACVLFAYLFGSLARNRLTAQSDIDIAVYLEEGTDTLDHKLALLGKLMDHLMTDDIDLVVLNNASLPLKARIIRDGTLLVDRQPHRRHVVESLILREHFDFSMFEGAILRRRFLLG